MVVLVRVVSKRGSKHLFLRATGEQSRVLLLHVLRGIIKRTSDGKSKEDERTGESCPQHLNGYSVKISIFFCKAGILFKILGSPQDFFLI